MSVFNPYFSGLSLAIVVGYILMKKLESRNPYFSGLSLAIQKKPVEETTTLGRNPYFSGLSLAIMVMSDKLNPFEMSQSLF